MQQFRRAWGHVLLSRASHLSLGGAWESVSLCECLSLRML